MPRPPRYGVRGLLRNPTTRNFEIDLRYHANGVARRYRERLPVGIPLAAAKARALEVVSLAAQGRLADEAEEERRLEQALEDYITWRKEQGRTSIDDAERHAEQLVAVVGDLPLSQLTALRLEAFKKARLADDVGPATVNRALTLFQHFGKMAAAWGWILREQALALRDCPKLREPPGRVRWLSDEERARLLAATVTNAGLHRVVVGLLLTGARLGELLALRVAHVDLEHASLTFARTKNGKSRTVPLHPELAALLPVADREPDAHVFLNREGEAWTADGLRASWYRATERAKLDGLRLHDLRHDHATRLRRNGASLELVKEQLGHSQISITTRYAHVGRDELHAAVAGLAHVAPPIPAARTMRLLK